MPVDRNHPTFNCPSNETKIWRYMDLAKFLSLITTKSLFFSNLTVLSNDDPYEGIYNELPRIFRGFRELSNEFGILGIRKKKGSSFLANLDVRQFSVFTSKNNRQRFFINCWHKSEFESIAMWKLYSFNEYGIAIESSIGKLCKALDICTHIVRVGQVKYLDYEKELIPLGDDYRPILCKRHSFEYEKEIRAVIKTDLEANAKVPTGMGVSVDLTELIGCVHISPTAPSWVQPALIDVVNSLKIDCQIRQSQLNAVR